MKILNTVRNRFAALNEDESGMEAAQVILILVLVVLGILPVLIQIKDQINVKGSASASGISAAK